MKREDILCMLREASDPASDCSYDELITINFGELERYTLLVAARVLASTYPEMFDIVSEAAKAEEREACAKVCEDRVGTVSMFVNSRDTRIHNTAVIGDAAAIRARN